jgi:hypothetical protein
MLDVYYIWYTSTFRILRSWTRQAKYSNHSVKYVTSPSTTYAFNVQWQLYSIMKATKNSDKNLYDNGTFYGSSLSD